MRTLQDTSYTPRRDEMKRNRTNQKILRDMECPNVLGYDLDRESLTPLIRYVDLKAPGDYGADVIGNGKFKMVPSGDIVDFDERCRRLSTKGK
jgi:hypothetical protein